MAVVKTKIKFYFSFRSPFSGVALYRMRRLACFNQVDIELLPVWPEIIFGGHMDNPTDNLFKLSYVFTDAARQAEEAGLHTELLKTFAKNLAIPQDLDFSAEKAGLKMPAENWPLTHHAFLYAKDQDKGWVFADAVFNARFGFDGAAPKNVLDRDVLREIAESLEIDSDEMLASCDSGAYHDDMVTIAKLSEADGVFGVPFFVFESGQAKHVFWGNDRIETLNKVVSGSNTLSLFTADDLGVVQR